MAQCLGHYPGIGLVTADKEVIDAEGRTTETSWWARQKQAEALYGLEGQPIEDAVASLLETNFINTSLAFVRTEILREVGLFDENIRFWRGPGTLAEDRLSPPHRLPARSPRPISSARQQCDSRNRAHAERSR